MTVTASPEFTTPQPAPSMPATPPKKRPTALIITAVAGALVVLAAGITAVVFAMKPSGPDPTDPRSAIPACHEQVKSKLKAPATAQFPGGERIENDGLQDKILGQVDAQNGFGALIRSQFRCLLAHDDAGKVVIASVTVEN